MAGEEAFCWCTGLRCIRLPDSLEEIGSKAFSYSGLESLTAPGQLRVIGRSAFRDCRSLRCVKLNEGLEVLGVSDSAGDNDGCGVFQGSALEPVELPSTLRKIACDAFRDCENLKNISLPHGLSCIGKRCFQRSGLEYVRFPPALRTV